MGWAALFGMLLPVLSAGLLLHATRWDRQTAPIPPALFLALAVGLGLGLSSATFFLALICFNGARAGTVALDLALFAAAGAAAWRRGRSAPRRSASSFVALDAIIAAAIFAAALAAMVTFFVNTLEDPHGQWDAWTTWNVRARWLARAGPGWWSSFAPHIVHGDYPLLVPAGLARLWVYDGSTDPTVAAHLAAVYAAALVLLLYGALAALRGRTTGLLGALCLLGTPLFLRTAAAQYADTPLAFMILASLTLLAVRDRDPASGPSVLAWAGLATALAAWTKNEGQLFVLCIVATRALLAALRRDWSTEPVKWFAAGFAPVAIVLLFFKIVLAPPSVFGGQRVGQLIERIGDPARYPAIARSLGFEGARGGGALLISLVLYGALLGRTRDRSARRAAQGAALVIGFVALGYGTVYLVSPAKLNWLLSHSLDRLVMHLWPGALLAFFLYVAAPDELWAPAARAAPESPRPARAAAAGRATSAPARRRRG